ncbi:MAG: hypothetical protein ABIH38_02295 [Patescibacteria group bacterium]
MKKIIFVFLFLALAATISACAKKTGDQNANTTGLVDIATGAADLKIKEKAEENLAIAQARDIFKMKKGEGLDMSDGPCLSNDLIDDWVLDIAHNPRQDVDNELANQCEAYRNGTAHHFVELDPEGNLIRAE